MKKNIKKKSFYFQIISLLVTCIAIPIIIISFLGCNKLIKNINVSFQHNCEKSTALILSMIQDITKDNLENIGMMADMPEGKGLFDDPKNLDKLVGNFSNYIKNHPEPSSIYVGLKDKRFIEVPDSGVGSSYNPVIQDWYKLALDNKGKAVCTQPYKDASLNQYDLTFAKTVEDLKGNVIGVVGLDVSLAKVNELVQKITIGKTGYAMVVDKSGVVVAHKDQKIIGTSVEKDKDLDNIMTSKSISNHAKLKSGDYFITKYTDSQTGYTVICLIPMTEINSTVKDNLISNIIIAVIVMILAVICGNIFTKNRIQKPIKRIIERLNRYSEGDFRIDEQDKKYESKTKEIDDINNALGKTALEMITILKELSNVSETLKENSNQLVSVTQQSTSVGEEVAKSVQQISEGAIQQSEKLIDTSNLVENLGENIDISIKNSNDMIESSEEVLHISNNGGKVVNELAGVFSETYNANIKVSNQANELKEKSNKIEEIVNVIKGITEQTNLLALNASIEAARAGESGKGFAVVADEVRKLAEESSKSAVEIGGFIQEIKNQVNDINDQIKTSMDLSNKTANSLDHTEKSFDDIKNSIQELGENITEVVKDLEMVKENKDNVVTNVESIASVAQETAATSEEVSASSEEQASGLQEVLTSAEKLDGISESLKQLVKKFQI